MRILIYTHEYPPFRGGAGTYSYDLARGLARLDSQVAVACPSYGDEAPLDRGSPAKVFRMKPWELDAPWCSRFLLKVLLKQPYDMAVITEQASLAAAARMPRRFFPYVIVVHGTEIWNFFDPNRRQIPAEDQRRFEKFFTSARAIVAGSHATARLLESYLPAVRSLIRVVPYCIDCSRFAEPDPRRVASLRQELAIGNNQVLFCLGRLNKDKGQDVLLRALRHVLHEMPDTILLLGGDGPMREELEQLSYELCVADRTRFLGNVADRDLDALFSLCDVFVLASRCVQRWEGFGLVFLEANLFGKPVVGGAVGGVPEAIEEGVSGLLVDPTDEHSVAAALVKLLKDPDLRVRLGEQGRQRVLERFDSRHMAEGMLEVIRQSLVESSSRRAASKLLYGLNTLFWLTYSLLLTAGARVRKLVAPQPGQP